MKNRIIIIIILLLTNIIVFSQSWNDLRPKWVNYVPNPPADANYFFSWGIGEDENITKATNKAAANALRRSLHEAGAIFISQQDISIVEEKGIDAEIKGNRMKRRIFCSVVIPKPDKTIRVYVLLQVERNVTGGKNVFYDANSYEICHDLDFEKKLEKYKKKYIERGGDFGPRSSALNGNSYVGWGIANGGYPWSVGTTVMGRFGGIIGIGFQVGIGADFGGKVYNEGDGTRKDDENEGIREDAFGYYVGVRLFPYQNIFLSANYGTLGFEKVNYYKVSSSNNLLEVGEPLSGYRQGSGFFFTAGYDLNLNKKNCNFLLSAQGGAGFDLFTGEWKPIAKLSIGVAWKTQKQK
jgi:hypothetical protein